MQISLRIKQKQNFYKLIFWIHHYILICPSTMPLSYLIEFRYSYLALVKGLKCHIILDKRASLWS